MDKKISLLLLIMLFIYSFSFLPLVSTVYALSSTVQTGLPLITIDDSCSRKTFYAVTRYWVFYIDDNADLSFKSSTNGSVWSSSNIALNTNDPIDLFDVYGIGNEVAIFCYEGSTDFDHHFRKGTLQSNGDITWSDSVLVFDGVDYNTQFPSIDKGTSDWWVASGTQNGSFYYYRIWSSSDGDSFTQRYETRIDATFHARYVVTQILPTSGNDVFFLFMDYDGDVLRYVKWNGASMSGMTNHTLTNPPPVETLKNDYFSATIDDNDLMHIVWRTTSDTLYYVTFDGSSWGSETQLDSGSITSPSIGVNTINDNLFVYYNKSDVIYSRNYTDSWNDAYTPFGSSFANPTKISCFKYITYGFIGIVWIEDGSSYDVHFGLDSVGISGVELVSVEILNLEGCGPWVFAQERYYQFNATFSHGKGWDSIALCGLRFSDGVNTIEVSYNVSSEEITLADGSDAVILKQGTVENKSLNILSVIYEIYFKQDIVDTYDIDIYLYGLDSDGYSTGWQLIAVDYFNIYNLGGLVEYDISGAGTDAGRIPKGDVFEFEIDATAGSPSVGWAEANWTWRNLQHIRMLPKIELPTAQLDGGYAGEWSLHYGIFYCVDDTWIKGWKCIIEHSSGFQSTKDFWIMVHVRWYRGESDVWVLQDESEYFYSFWNPEPESCTSLFVDLWFNSGNASSIGGGRVSCEYYGMQDSAPWWAFWYSDWGPMLSNSTTSSYYMDLLDADGNVTSTQQIELVKVYCRLEKTSSTGSYAVRVRDYTVLDKVFAHLQAPFYGIDTPDEIPPKVMDMPQGGFFGWLFQGLKNLLKSISPPLLSLWNTFVGFIDTVFTFAG